MRTAIAALCAAVLAAGCASEVKRVPVDLAAAAPETGRRYVSTATVEAKPATGYARTIRTGTEFIAMGRVSHGLVLRPIDTVLTLEGAHIHEAYVVHHNGQWVGFFLPIERAYSVLPSPVSMPLKEK
jgi:hypothetical protein